nr:hypothetical protein GCM10025732_07310 [Glycomyces mayteni]
MPQAARRPELLFRQALHQDRREPLGVQARQERRELAPQRLPQPRVGRDADGDRLASLLQFEALPEQRTQVQDLHAVLGEDPREPVVLLLGALDPRDAVEQQRAVVARRQAPQLSPGAVEHDAAQAPHFRVDSVRGRGICTHDPRVDAPGTKINFSQLTWTD